AAEGFAIAEALYPAGHPARHRIIGSHEDLQSLTVEDVATFLSQWYGPANATLAISGDIAPGQTRALVNKWFADLPGSGQEPVRPVWPPPALNADVERTIEDPFTKVGRVHMAWPSPPITTTEDGAFDLLAFILADPRVGRLWNASPFDVFLDVSAYQLSREQGSEFHISIDGATQSVVSAAKRSILEVLQDIATRGVTPVDLARARESYETSLNQGLETLSGRTNWFQLLNRIATAPNDFAWLRRRWDLASPQVIRDLATQLLGSRRVTVVTLPKGGL
ncbi:MAG TPA: insulinase family protein, partial [Polyangia bacterium]